LTVLELLVNEEKPFGPTRESWRRRRLVILDLRFSQ
jgi:hypothetical protein